jgi:hypothetical protein
MQYLSKHLPTGVPNQVLIRHMPGGAGSDGHRTDTLEEERRGATAVQSRRPLAEFAEQRHRNGRTVKPATSSSTRWPAGRCERCW